MKNLIVLMSLVVSINIQAATYQCGQYDNGLWPVNKDAVNLANALKVSKCDGKMFNLAVEMKKGKIEIVGMPKDRIKQIEADRTKKRAKRVKKALKRAGLN